MSCRRGVSVWHAIVYALHTIIALRHDANLLVATCPVYVLLILPIGVVDGLRLVSVSVLGWVHEKEKSEFRRHSNFPGVQTNQVTIWLTVPLLADIPFTAN
jgi:hypothetical protein